MPHYTLDELLRGIALAVSDANHELTTRARADLESHFVPNASGDLEPRTTALVLPRDHVGEGEDSVGTHQVPHAALSHHRPIGLDTLKVELDCVIDGVEAGTDGQPRVRIRLGSEIAPGAEAGRLSIQFKVGEAPEGAARINDKLLKLF